MITVPAINSRQLTSANDGNQVYRGRVPKVVASLCSIHYASCRICRSRGRNIVLELVPYRSMSPSVNHRLPTMVIDSLYCIYKTAETTTESQCRYSGSIHADTYCTLPAPPAHRDLLEDLIHNKREVFTASILQSLTIWCCTPTRI